VIRLKPTAHTIFLEADFDSQYKVIKSFAEHTDVPLPPVHWYEDDESVLGDEACAMPVDAHQDHLTLRYTTLVQRSGVPYPEAP
jgi:aminoglycoside phosphotransferase (APT) family kinase protein